MKAVVFDMDGLMFDTERISIESWNYAGEKAGIGRLDHIAHRVIGMNETAAKNMWREMLGKNYDEKLLGEYRTEYFVNFYNENTVPVKKGLYELLEYLKRNGFKMAVASSTKRSVVERNLNDTDVMKYFNAIICGDMIERSKPEPDIYLKACEMLGEAPENCYAIEDSRNGILSAYRAGCKAIMIPDIWQPDKEFLNIVTAKFDDLSEVIKYLEDSYD